MTDKTRLNLGGDNSRDNNGDDVGDGDGGGADADMVFADLGDRLADAIEEALPSWVERCVIMRAGHDAASTRATEVADAGQRAATEIAGQLRQLLELEVDRQWTNPLSIVRGAVRYPTDILRQMGVPPQQRDRFASTRNPDDLYDLTPSAFAEFGPEAHERGIMWGAAKAHLHLRRRSDRGAEGRPAG